LPDEETTQYAITSNAIKQCLNVLTDKTDKIFFIPGNNEWSDGKQYTLENLHSTEHFLEEIVSQQDIMRPSQGCGDPEIIELTNDLILVLVDSHERMYISNEGRSLVAKIFTFEFLK